jgi:hypothetical protein
MAVPLRVEFDQLLEAAQLLPDEQQDALIARLLLRRAGQRELTPQEKAYLFDTGKIHLPVNQTPSVRREDWYDDDGR